MNTHCRTGALLFLVAVVSCSPPASKQVVNALADNDTCRLDSARIQTVFRYMQHFPNGSELSVALLLGDSTTFVGIKRINDSVICVENRTSVFEIGSVTKTVTATMLAKLVYDGVVDLIVHAAIAFADTITIRFGGVKSMGENHHEAIALVESNPVPKVQATRKALNQLRSILDEKTAVSHSGEVYDRKDVEKMRRLLERYRRWALDILAE